VSFIIGNVFSFGEWNSSIEIVIAIVISIIFALVCSYIINNDIIHTFLRSKWITRETSYIKGWYGAFSEHSSQYIVLHLKDGRRIMGLPEEWPTQPESGVFQLSHADWLLEKNKTIQLTNVDTIMFKAEDVFCVEFIMSVEKEKMNDSHK